ncbi:MAG: DNA-processing protein DprA [Burkholderiales bacterium]
MLSDDDLAGWLRLALTPGVGDASLRRLLNTFGTPDRVFNAGYSRLAAITSAGIARLIADGGNADGADAALAWRSSHADNAIITLADAEYPQRLLETPDPPTVLYGRGRVETLNRPALAIVGSRNATAQGIETAEEFARSLSRAGLAIISGLALGIDAAAHRGGLDGASGTVAVIGTGIDIVYPARNRELAHAITESGMLVSEFPLGTRPLAANFPRRNRLISGMALGCLVVEAALRSGSLITARLAADQGREVFAIPGSIHSPLARGCHALIRQGAKLVETAADVLEELRLAEPIAPCDAPNLQQADDSGLMRHLGFDPCDVDTLCARSGLAAETVVATLMQLELAGRVEALAGGRYQRRH